MKRYVTLILFVLLSKVSTAQYWEDINVLRHKLEEYTVPPFTVSLKVGCDRSLVSRIGYLLGWVEVFHLPKSPLHGLCTAR